MPAMYTLNMKKLKAFFYVYKNSLFSPAYYKELLKTDIKFSIKYYLILVFVASLFITTFETILISPKIKKTLNEFGVQAKQIYPEDLVIEFKDGDWTINREQPFVVPMPQISNENLPENAIVFYKNGTISDVGLFDTVILINSVNIIARNNNGIQARSLEGFPDIRIDRDTFEDFINFVFSFSKVLPFLIFIFTLFGLMIYYLFFRLAYGLGAGFVVYALSFLNKKPLDYIKSFRIALHTMTLPITIQVILGLARVSMGLPLWFFMLNLFFAVYVLFKISESSLKKKR